MAAGIFKPNSAAFRAMAVGPELAAAVTAKAEEAKTIAESLSQDFRVSGEYAESFVVTTEETTLRTGFGSHPVVAGVLTNESGHAAAVEYGNEHDHRAHHVLGRTLDSLND